MSDKTLSRRAALLKIGGLAAAVYTVPAVTTLSAARASDASSSSASSSSGTSDASEPSEPSNASEPSVVSEPSGPSKSSLRDQIVDGPSCETAGGRFDAAANTCTISN